MALEFGAVNTRLLPHSEDWRYEVGLCLEILVKLLYLESKGLRLELAENTSHQFGYSNSSGWGTYFGTTESTCNRLEQNCICSKRLAGLPQQACIYKWVIEYIFHNRCFLWPLT